ncbi:MAG: HpcH/HpaI aldolase/citrate lyase family protein [Solirubrobacteraceae bacterium]
MSGPGSEAVDWRQRPLRAILFVPGNDQRKLEKAGTTGADLVVIDLEDAVAEKEKTQARATTSQAVGCISRSAAVAVRVNGVETGRLGDDISAVAHPGLSAIVVPKVEGPDSLVAADETLAKTQRTCRPAPGMVVLIALIETPLGIARCEEILLRAPAHTVTAMFGVADFSAALGIELTEEGTELLYARGRLIVATRAAGLAAPIDGPYLRIDDTEGLLQDSRRSRALGFQGRVALHPRQVAPINRAFSELSSEQIAAAKRIVEAFEAAEANGVASIRVAGRFVDYPVYEQARAKLRRHESYLRTVD